MTVQPSRRWAFRTSTLSVGDGYALTIVVLGGQRWEAFTRFCSTTEHWPPRRMHHHQVTSKAAVRGRLERASLSAQLFPGFRFDKISGIIKLFHNSSYSVVVGLPLGCSCFVFSGIIHQYHLSNFERLWFNFLVIPLTRRSPHVIQVVPYNILDSLQFFRHTGSIVRHRFVILHPQQN